MLPPYVHDSYSGLMNFNRVETVQNFFGGKIGETEAAHQTSISLHHVPIHDSTRDIAVILLRSEGRKDDVLRLLAYLEERFNQE